MKPKMIKAYDTLRLSVTVTGLVAMKPYPNVMVTHPDGTIEPAQWCQEGQDWVFPVKAGDIITTSRVEPYAKATISARCPQVDSDAVRP